jgi:hypothetical protein
MHPHPIFLLDYLSVARTRIVRIKRYSGCSGDNPAHPLILTIRVQTKYDIAKHGTAQEETERAILAKTVVR